MKRYMLLFALISTNFIYSQTYCAGEQISMNHQMQDFEVCYGSGDYETGDSWKLADFNGELNGGNYHVIWLEMSASW